MAVFFLSLLMFFGVVSEGSDVGGQNKAKAFVDNYDLELMGFYLSDLELGYDYEIESNAVSGVSVILPVAIVVDYSLVEKRLSVMNSEVNLFEEKQASVLWQENPKKAVDIKSIFDQEQRRLRIPGIVYNETSGVYPALKTGLKPRGIMHWDDDSREQLNKARLKMAMIANDGRKKMAHPFVPQELKLSVHGKAQWDDCKSVAILSDGIKSSDEHFVIWPSEDGKHPLENPRIKAKWPYEYKDNIHEVYGPFRIPVQVGDVPAGDNIYIFFYKDVP